MGALLTKELRKPAAQRDEELVHKLRVHHRQLELKNAEVGGPARQRRRLPHFAMAQQASLLGLDVHTYFSNILPTAAPQASLRKYKQGAVCFDRSTRQCCGAAQWVAQRVAASYRAAADFYEQTTQQVGLSAAEAVSCQPGAACSCLAACTTLLLNPSIPAPLCFTASPSLPCPVLGAVD